MNLTDKIYARSPVWLQNTGISLYGAMWKRRRFGGEFLSEVGEFIKRESFSEGQWLEYQSGELRRLLTESMRDVPHYRKSFSAHGMAERDLLSIVPDELYRLPLLEKNHIRESPEAFIPSKGGRKLHAYHTSGTTGTPVAILMSTRMHQRWSAAYEVRCRGWAGVDHSMRRAMIGGRMVVPEGNSLPPFWRYNRAEKQLYFSAFHLSPENVKYYARELNRFRPDYLVGYASSHYFLARLIEEEGLEAPRVLAVLTSSEKLTSEMRATIERVYRTAVFDAYSGVEAHCLASECEHHRLHVSPDVGIIEIVDENGSSVPPGETGEIVATGLLNFDQPLIRFRTGDLASYSTEPCPCGRAMPVLKELVGRLEDTVIGKDGRELVRFHGIFINLPNIREGQVVQESLDTFTVRVVAPVGVTEKDEATIRRRFFERLGPVTVAVVCVPEIERSPSGKFRAVISKVPRSAERTTV